MDDSDERTAISFTFDFFDHVDVYQGFPRLLKLTFKVCLQNNTCTNELLVENLDTRDAPIGFGMHTWFHLEGGKSKWSLTLPFEKVWELDEEVMPTGTLLSGEKIAAVKQGVSLGDKIFDTLLYRGNASPVATLIDTSGYKIEYEVDSAFKHWIAHTPTDDDSTIALEPYTWVTNAPHLKLDPDLTGILTLRAKESLVFKTVIRLPK